ncbi:MULTISPECIES: winged helix-turn-helix domain-containing protein [unclassified Shewanella]|nr:MULTISPECIES: winged helix-turn-helix domain-containing protein [unclassified Shewanella]MCK7633227.1 winged helix-turn-helix domain-containing protein [Shewanella sp. JNE17]MCK7648452.1 winged helix-turn-helix domain-containing protein [Shewanella sp. JNE8]MCK7656533.1 winged helix-turn-helix domain-containing protein [Shewanella sp. JNE4-2]UPO29570.1 winged helix-turn-helix domain-containing protein [Shewanella sp. JNE2]
MGRRQVELAGESIKLTETEFELLWLLASNPEQPVSRDDISLSLRGIEYDGLDRSIDNKIVSLRKKLGDAVGLPRRIITVRGKGYLFITDQWQVND